MILRYPPLFGQTYIWVCLYMLEQLTHTQTHQWDPIEMNTQGPSWFFLNIILRFLDNAYGIWLIWLMVWQPTVFCEYVLSCKFRWWQSKHTGTWNKKNIPKIANWQERWKSMSFHHVEMGFRMGKWRFPACSLVCLGVIWVPKYASINRLYRISGLSKEV